MKRLTLAGALLAIAGCAFDLTDVAVNPRGAILSITLIAHSPSGGLDIDAAFDPGIDGNGSVRTLSEASLGIDQTAFGPDQIETGGAYTYRLPGHPAGNGSGETSLSFRSPSVRGISEPPPEFRMGILRVAGPDSLLASSSGPASLSVEGLNAGDIGLGIGGERLVESSVNGYWSLELVSDDGSYRLRLTSSETPPSSLEIPMQLLPAGFVHGHVEIRGGLRQMLASAGGGYSLQINRIFRASIPVRVVD
jgi:hypothetical protein